MSFINNIINFFKGGPTNMSSEELKNHFTDKAVIKAYLQYDDKASYIDNVVIKSMNAAKAIVQEIKRPVLQEFDFKIESKNETFTELEKSIKKQLKKLTTHLLIAGRVALKPYMIGNKINVTVVTANDFKPYYDSYGNLIEVIFKTQVIDNSKYYTLIERHIYDMANSTYTIINKLFKSSYEGNYGDEVKLDTLDMFKSLKDTIVFTGINKHLCTVINMANNSKDYTGLPVYADAYNLIEELDRQYSRYIWEYEGGQLAIDADADLFMEPGKPIDKNRNVNLPFGTERLYRTINGHNANLGINIFAPQLRDEAYERGINTICRQIEVVVGLSAGKLSNASSTQLTATEIISAQQRFYSTITSIQEVISEGIVDIIDNIVILYSKNSMPFISTTYDIIWNVGDSILTTSAEKVQERLLLVEKGIYTIEEFKEWYEGIV